MSALSNPKHERFAQERAKGATADAAYELAGFKANRGNATRLNAIESVQSRIAEIQERAAVRAEVTVASITERLLNIAAIAEKTGVGKDKDTGDVTGSSSKHLTVARAALMDAAKLNGLVVDKAEHSGGVTLLMQDQDDRL